MIRALIFLALLCGSAHAQNGLQSARPQGFFGVGHAEWHHIYSKIRKPNGNGGWNSCCNGEECRPTQARWTGAVWEVMVNGHWREFTSDKIITSETLEELKLERPGETASVCEDGGTIYCVILPATGG